MKSLKWLCGASLAALCAACGPQDGSEAADLASTEAAAEVDPNPYNLEADILNPFPGAALVSQAPPLHHRTVNFKEDLSFDIIRNTVTAGADVVFRARPIAPATEVQGRVLAGGSDALKPVCQDNDWASGGGGLKVGIELKHNGVWTNVGWVLYGHVENVKFEDGDTFPSGTVIATTVDFGKLPCWDGAHLHMGLFNNIHYPCWITGWVDNSSIAVDGSIGRVGGQRNRLSLATPPASIASCSQRLKGDANGSGVVDVVDALVTAQSSAGLAPTPFYSDSADADCNGLVDILDAYLISRYASGLNLRLCP